MKIKLLTALLALLACTSVAQARTYFDWTGLTYLWSAPDTAAGYGWYPVDSYFNVVAKDPAQMHFLKSDLMHNQKIPGTLTEQIKDGMRTGVDYHDTIYVGADHHKELKDYTPEEEGFTCLLIGLKAGVNSKTTPNEPKSIEDFANSVDSIKLLTNTTECDKAYISTFSGNWDRFYFASKGKPRMNPGPSGVDGDFVSFPCAWELFSPTGNAKGVDGTPGFYKSLQSGGVYLISHDCANVGGLKHYFSINPDGAAPLMKNVAIMVPKNRMEWWNESLNFQWPDGGRARDNNGMFTWYHPDYCPRIAIYKASLSVTCTKSTIYDQFTDEGSMCEVLLNWKSNLKDENGLKWPGNETYEIYYFDEKGERQRLTTVHDVYQYRYMVQRTDLEQKIKYQVVCYPTGTNPNDPVQAITNEATITIPAFKDLYTEYTYQSRFIPEMKENSYKNTIIVYPGSEGGDCKIYMTPNSLTHSADFSRKTVEIAEIVTDRRQVGQEYYWVNYNGPMREDEEDRYDDEPLDEGGHLTGHPDQGIFVTDYFVESTNLPENLRASSYTYSISVYRETTHDWSTPRVIAEIPVYSGELTNPQLANPYAYNDIRNDIKKVAPLALKPSDQISFNFIDYQNDDVSDFESLDRELIDENSDDLAEGLQADITIPLGENAGQEIFGQYGEFNEYYNTYGTKPITLPDYGIDIDVPVHERGWQWYGSDGTQKVISATIHIKPRFPQNETNYVYYYTVTESDVTTEVEGDQFLGTEEVIDVKVNPLLLNSLEDQNGFGWSTNYAPIKTANPIGTSSTKEVAVREVRVVDDDRDESHTIFKKCYTVRMYFSKKYLSGKIPLNQKIYVLEKDYFVNIDGVITAVNDVNVDKTVVDVKYYNLMGVCSDKPFDGANIKVERHADGTTTTTKMMK